MPISIETILNDERLAVIFNNADTHCAVQLWLLQIKKETLIETRLLYGRVLPYSFSNNQWNAPSEDNFKAINDYKAQVILINLYCNSNKVSQLLVKLCQAEKLSAISNALELTMSTQFKKRFGDFCLIGEHCYRPVSYLPMRNRVNNGLKSPHHSSGAFSAAVIPFNKNELFVINETIDVSLLNYAINFLNNDTGLSFDKEDSERLSDLELLVFPTLNEYEHELLQVDWQEKYKILDVSLEQGKYYNYDIFYIKANFIDDNHVLYSALKSSLINNNKVFVSFELPDCLNESVDELFVEIYAQKNTDTNASLYCQYHVSLVREISNTSCTPSGITGTINLDWLTKVTKLPASHSRIVNAQTVNQGSYTMSSFIVGGRKQDPWVSINRNNKKILEKNTLNRKKQPKLSEGRFFECYNDGEGTGRLEFKEWIKTVLNNHQNHQIIIFDPYFEDVGISLVISDASVESQYIIFTTKESRSEQQRLNNLMRCFEQLSLFINSINLKVYALENHAFHDRFILIADKNAEPIQGFHLSNSIQKANENYPLLITPIPHDVLIKVNGYALDMLNKQTLAPFFDSKLNNKNITKKRYESLPFLNESLAGTVLAKWTGKSELNGLRAETLKNQLTQLGFLQGESLNNEAFVDRTMIFNFLSNLSNNDFNTYWNITGDILANTSECIGNDYQSTDIVLLCNQLFNYLNDKSLEISLDTYDIKQAFFVCQSFNKSIKEVFFHERPYNFYYRIKFSVLSWGEYYALNLLWHNAPKHLLDFIENINTKIDSSSYQREHIKIYYLLAQAISEISLNVEFGLTKEQILLLINRDNDFIKWLGYCALEKAIIKNNSLLSIIIAMQNSDKIMLLSWLINRTEIKDENQNPLFKTLVSEYLAVFSTQLTKNETELCINSLRGRMQYLGYCEPWLSKFILLPLIENNRVSYDDLANFWFEELQKLFETNDYFNENQEGKTTNIAAYLIANCSIQCQKDILTLLKKRLNTFSRDIQKPLASTSNWEKWNDSLNTVFWIYGLLKWIYSYLPLPSLIELELVALLNKADNLRLYRAEQDWQNYELKIFLE